MVGETITVTRRFSHAQAEKRAQAKLAATQLASRDGYAAVTMAAVADLIGISRATIYRYFASKDHLLAEIMEEWTERINEDLVNHPPPGRGRVERVQAAFERIIETAARNPGLTSALAMAATSSDPAAIDAFPSWSNSVEVYLKTLIRDEDVARFGDIVTVMSHVLFSNLIAMSLRGQSAEESVRVLRTTIDLVFAQPEIASPEMASPQLRPA